MWAAADTLPTPSFGVKLGLRGGMASGENGAPFAAKMRRTGLHGSPVQRRGGDERRRHTHLYEKLRFRRIGTIPGGYRLRDGHCADIHIYFHPTERQ